MQTNIIEVNGSNLPVLRTFNTRIGQNMVPVSVVQHNALDVPIFRSDKDGVQKWTVVPQRVYGEFKGIKGNELKRQFHALLMDCTLLNTGFAAMLTDGKLTITGVERRKSKGGAVKYVAKAVEKGSLNTPLGAQAAYDAALKAANDELAKLKAENEALKAAMLK